MGRQCLPEPVESEPSLNLWTLVKDWVGKARKTGLRLWVMCKILFKTSAQCVVTLLQDIQSLPLPLSLHEPTTEMMKAAEDMEHSSLLDEACLLAVPCHSSHVEA